jgi:hypothetical protein
LVLGFQLMLILFAAVLDGSAAHAASTSNAAAAATRIRPAPIIPSSPPLRRQWTGEATGGCLLLELMS